MKKILFVNNNMKVGGVQKSLYNLLWSLDELNKYDVTLLLFSKCGEYLQKLPKSVKVIEVSGPFRFFGKNQSEFKSSFKEYVFRGFYATVAKFLGREKAVSLMLKRELVFTEQFDCAVSFLHNGRRKSFYGGVQDYTIYRVNAKKKITFVHGDYNKCGANYFENNQMLRKFDYIAACTDGCREVLVSALPDLNDKCMTVRNCHRFDEIIRLSKIDTCLYKTDCFNIVIVARLTGEKGIDRAILAIDNAVKKGAAVALHIVGGGPLSEQLKKLVSDRNISDFVSFYGEQSNPYKYMLNADMLLVSSYHEAGPMVIDEARCLGVPVLCCKTIPSYEMVIKEAAGWECENNQDALNDALYSIVCDPTAVENIRKGLLNKEPNNNFALSSFEKIVGL